jgi:hypothetical protein
MIHLTTSCLYASELGFSATLPADAELSSEAALPLACSFELRRGRDDRRGFAGVFAITSSPNFPL